jgi:hypothetical protein
MTDFLSSIKADLLDRRIVPLVALVAVAVAAAAGYAVLGGGSSTATPSTAVSTPGANPAARGIAVTAATPGKAVAETTSGTSDQRGGTSRDPFAPLPGTAKSAVTSKSSTALAGATSAVPSSSGSGSSSTTSGSSTSGAGSHGGTGSAPTTPSKPAAPAKPQTVYHVAVLFGVAPPEPPVEGVQLTPYENLKLLTPLPSSAQALIVFRGVTAGGKSATFTLVGEAILHGNAACLPSASQCQAIDLQVGQAEKLEYLPPSGQPVTYELKIVSISPSSASSASVKSVLREESKAGREVLRHAGLIAIPDLRYSTHPGVLVFAGHPAFAARAHAAHRPRHRA